MTTTNKTLNDVLPRVLTTTSDEGMDQFRFDTVNRVHFISAFNQQLALRYPDVTTFRTIPVTEILALGEFVASTLIVEQEVWEKIHQTSETPRGNRSEMIARNKAA